MSLHWSMDDASEPDTSYQNAAIEAWRNYNAPATDDTPDSISFDDLNETPYQDVYSDADNNWYAIEADSDGQHIATPVDPGQVELESSLMAGFLQTHGENFDTASHEQLMAAAEHADAWLERAEQTVGVQRARSAEDASLAEEQAAAGLFDQFVEQHDSTVEEVLPYLDLAIAAMENGESFESAMQQAGNALDKWKGEVNTAAREEHFSSLGYDKGVKSALSNFMREQHGPRHRAGNAPGKPISQSNTPQGLGSVQASKDQVSNALSRFMQNQHEKTAVRDLAKDHVRNR